MTPDPTPPAGLVRRFAIPALRAVHQRLATPAAAPTTSSVKAKVAGAWEKFGTIALLGILLYAIPAFMHGYLANSGDPQASYRYQGLELAHHAFLVEVANTPAKMKRGLTGRLGLFPRSGMLFAYPEKQRPVVSMEGMYFPITAITLDEDWNVLETQTLTPGPGGAGAVHRFERMAMALLELSPEDLPATPIQPGHRILKFQLSDFAVDQFVRAGGKRSAPVLASMPDTDTSR